MSISSEPVLESVRIAPAHHEIAGDWQTVSFSVSGLGGGAPAAIHYRVPADLTLNTADCAVATTLLPAMRRGRPIESALPLSPRLAASLPTLQDIWMKWQPDWARVSVSAPPATTTATPTGVASFFTGGVDSFYTLLKHQHAIDTLIYVHGFDLLPDGHPHGGADPALRAQVSAMLHEVAAHYSKRLIEVHTDLRLFSDAHVDWWHFHGAALASVGLLLAPQFKTIHIASSNPYDLLEPVGSHPLLDPLWSTESLSFVHDGCEASRRDKLAMIAEHPFAYARLRVCWENWDGAYNCGRCLKCLKTLVAKRLVGLEPAASFPGPLDLSALSRLRFDKPAERPYAIANVKAALARGDHALVRALKRYVRRNDRRYALQALWSPLRQRLRGWPWLARVTVRAWRR